MGVIITLFVFRGVNSCWNGVIAFAFAHYMPFGVFFPVNVTFVSLTKGRNPIKLGNFSPCLWHRAGNAEAHATG